MKTFKENLYRVTLQILFFKIFLLIYLFIILFIYLFIFNPFILFYFLVIASPILPFQSLSHPSPNTCLFCLHPEMGISLISINKTCHFKFQ